MTDFLENRTSKRIPSGQYSLDDLKNVYEKLSTLHDYILKDLLSRYSSDQNVINNINNNFKLNLHCRCTNGLVSMSANFEDFAKICKNYMVDQIIFENQASLQVRNIFQPIFLKLVFDFTKPVLLDFSRSPTLPTTNLSTIDIVGDNPQWVSGAMDELLTLLNKNRRFINRILNAGLTYDVLLWFIFIPVLIFCVIPKINSLSFLASYNMNGLFCIMDIFFIVIFLYFFRFVFDIGRRLYPYLEFKNNQKPNVMYKIGYFVLITLIADTITLGNLLKIFNWLKNLF